MKKIVLLLSGLTLTLFSACSLLGDDTLQADPDTGKLYEVYTKFKEKYDAQKDYVAKNSFDTVGQSDLKETEKNLNFLTVLLNDGVACAKADYQYDPLGFYFPWYKAMKPVDEVGGVVTDGSALQEFCYSNLSGSAVYSFKKMSAVGETGYGVYAYLAGGVNKNYKEVSYLGAAECALGEWTDAQLEWSCKYEDKDKVKKEDKYAYDFFFEEATLKSTCTGEGETKVCKNL